MNEFTAEDNDGDQFSAVAYGGILDLVVRVDDKPVLLNPQQVVDFRKWLDENLTPPTAPKLVIPESDAGESPEQPAGTSDVDKLRILAAVIDAQAPLGTDLADFKRRLQIVLGA